MKTISLIEKIRKACISANEEIVELKFGCEVSISPREDMVGVLPNYDLILCEKSKGREDVWITTDHMTVNITGEDIKIIGRSLGIADILLAMEKASSTLSVDTAGYFYELDEGEPLSRYNLKETFENQTDVFKRFIHNILFPNDS
ncbi:MAG: hypothetical protein KJI69_05075 [Patescibacteria group bacterium]|nr:hypothetical protein [Patescibacteria group bacterium]